MKYLYFLLILISCNPFDSDSTTKQDATPFQMSGAWFLCETFADPSQNQDCQLVDDDGIYFTDSDSVFRIDGALSYARKMGDSLSGNNFHINVPELYFFDEKEVFYGVYNVKGDTVNLNGYSTESGESLSSQSTIDKQRSILAIMGSKKYRKYNGKAHLITKAAFIELITVP